MSYLHEFSDYDHELIVPEGWTDKSWHNDTCPCIVKEAGNRMAMIFQDYDDVSLREVDYTKQYALYLSSDIESFGEVVFDSESDSFDELLAKAETFLSEEVKQK